MKKNKKIPYDFLNHFSSLLMQGYDIETIFKICSLTGNKEIVKQLHIELNNGISLDDALLNCHFHNRFDEYFSFYRFKSNVGEAIEKTLEVCKKFDDLKKKLIKELSYPVALLIFMLFFSLFVVYGLMDNVERLFVEFGIEQSIYISIVFTIFKIIPFFVIISFITGLSLTIYIIHSVKNLNYHVIDFCVEKTYIIGHIIKKYYSLKFAIYYGELLDNGYDSTEIIHLLYNEIHDSDIKMIIYEIDSNINKGESLFDIVDQFDYFEVYFKESFWLINSLDNKKQILNNYIQFTIDSVSSKINRWMKRIIPFIYLFVGCFVILIYISIILPMMNIVNTL